MSKPIPRHFGEVSIVPREEEDDGEGGWVTPIGWVVTDGRVEEIVDSDVAALETYANFLSTFVGGYMTADEDAAHKQEIARTDAEAASMRRREERR